MCNGKSGGISLTFNKFPKSRPFLQIIPISCSFNLSFAIAVRISHSYFIHRKLCFRLSKRTVACQGMLIRDNILRFPSTLTILFKNNDFCPSQVFRLTQFLSLCSLKTWTLGKLTGVQHKIFVFIKYQHFTTQP